MSDTEFTAFKDFLKLLFKNGNFAKVSIFLTALV